MESIMRSIGAGSPALYGELDLTDILGHQKDGALYILTGGPGVGKTSLLIANVMEYLSRSSKTHEPQILMISAQDSEISYQERYIANLFGLSLERIRRGNLSEEETEAILKTTKSVAFRNAVTLFHEFKGVDHFMPFCADQLATFGKTPILIDGLGQSNEPAHWIPFCREMAEFAKQHAIPVMLCIQTSGQSIVYVARSHPTEAAGVNILHGHADVVIHLHSVPDDKKNSLGETLAFICSNRFGQTGVVRININKDLQRTDIVD